MHRLTQQYDPTFTQYCDNSTTYTSKEVIRHMKAYIFQYVITSSINLWKTHWFKSVFVLSGISWTISLRADVEHPLHKVVSLLMSRGRWWSMSESSSDSISILTCGTGQAIPRPIGNAGDDGQEIFRWRVMLRKGKRQLQFLTHSGKIFFWRVWRERPKKQVCSWDARKKLQQLMMESKSIV